MMKRKNIIILITCIVLFVSAIVLCIAAICGHNSAYAAAACCFFGATAGMSALNKNQSSVK